MRLLERLSFTNSSFCGYDFSGARYVEVYPSSCLERGVTYQIRLDFNRYRSDRLTPDASILIDSVCALSFSSIQEKLKILFLSLKDVLALFDKVIENII